ncbi:MULTISPECIES: YhgE/Pip domain-containing protein [unclassified Paenibacillus]|uniref:YhgE/Pip domain-containing protein n=1 Tax=unclassified Paenibacillus TaxID=185978 RepID=UPI002406AAB4|nr:MULTISPECIES: YhgE/Pip domain-containing protein [unclassified Paenibacillus]MDF9843589.1 putative membrane protein [Paenibacillus sp. PastF-2]MDF9850178.1 putative membrane protein [Paenibacillus sp. PastM-2]MDF9857080.1 putative membrane protein [Paenibacillus sp. PastF-1]MDH6482352.1 putative membrane protein [Paenibacillus sp. PastH-2]MDH6509310.1 putative membrane protein [Paenibacillus sp. PastM-3]
MRAINVFWKDLKILLGKPMLLITLLGVSALPMLYSGFLVEGSWDPYGNTGKLPVAVVNLDKGAQYEGKTMEVGNDFVDELKTNTDFNWQFVDAAEAEDGMAHNRYYMTITIPADFSQNATTLTQEKPVQSEIIFEPNSDYNFVAGQIGNSAMNKLKSKLSAQITEAYTRSMYEQVDTIAAGLGDAGSGASELQEGADKLTDGLSTLKTNLNKLSSGTTELQSGLKLLYKGAGSLNEGTGTLTAGTADLASGLSQLSKAEQQLQAGAEKSQSGASQLAAGLESAKDGSSKLTAGLSASEAASGQLASGAQQVAAGLEQMLAATPELQDSEQFQQLLAASKQVAAGSVQLHSGQEQLLAGSTQLTEAQQQLYDGAAALSSGGTQLVTGLSTFGDKLNDATSGSSRLADGAVALKQGASQLAEGLTKLAGGVDGLSEGAGKLTDGAGELQDGSGKLASGSGELAQKLNDAATETASVNSSDDTVSMFAEPVKLVENTDRKLDHYGLGIAPYFLSLALFMGALVFTTVFSLRESSVPDASPMGRFASRTLMFVMVSVLQSLLADAVLLYGLKLQVQSVPLFYLFTLIVSFTFTMIVQALVTWLDNPGRFLAIVLMIFQLTSSAGTFPLELLPQWMQKVNPWLPMTHSIVGYKAIIASGDYALMREQIVYLLSYAALFLCLTFFYFLRQNGKRTNTPAQELTA